LFVGFGALRSAQRGGGGGGGGGVVCLVDKGNSEKSKFVVGWSSPMRQNSNGGVASLHFGDVDHDGLDELIEVDASGRIRVWGVLYEN